METEIKTETVSERVRSERTATRDRAEQTVNRRRDPRFRVPGGTVRLPCKPFQICGTELDVRQLLFGFLPSLVSSRRELVNLSKGGLAFESRLAVPAGVRVQLQLSLPGRAEPLSISGETRWCSKGFGGLYTVGVQFDSFSDRGGANPPALLAVLRELETKYA